MTTSGFLSVERRGPVAVVRMDRPPVNAFDRSAAQEILRWTADATADDDLRAVVWHGGRHFAAGADIAHLRAMGFEEISGWNALLQASFTSVAALPVPVVAAVTGYALGGGLELALCADYRVAAAGAKVGLPEVQLGIVPGSGGTQRLTRLVGRSRAKELILSGRTVGVEEAFGLGIVDEVVEDADRALARATELAEAFARGPRHAVRAIKQLVDAAEPPLEPGLALERATIAGLFATEDKRRGMESFLRDGPGHAEFT